MPRGSPAPGPSPTVAVGNEAQVWNPQVRRLEHRIRKESTVRALDWSPDGSQIALGTESGHLEIVDFPAASTRPLLVTREGLALQHDPSGKHIAFFRGNTGIGFWDVESSPVFQSLAAPPGSEHHFTDLAVSPDALLVAGVNRQHLVVWELETQRQVARHGLPGAEGVAWSPDGTSLVTASAEGLTRWEFRREDTTPDQRLRKVPDSQRPPINGRFHRVSPSLIAASASDSAWLIRPWETNAPLPVPHGTVTTFAHVTCDPAGQIVVASLWKGGGTWMRDLVAGTEPRELEPIGGFARFTPDGLFLLTGSNRGYRLWDVYQWRECARLDQQLSADFPGLGLFPPDGQHAFVIHGHRRIAQVTVPDLRPEAVLEAPGEANLYALACEPTARVLLAGTDDSRVFIWRLMALERALSDLGIPALSSLESTNRSRWDVRPLRWVLVAFATAAVLALHTLWRQRGLVQDYLHIETLMAERNRQLLQAREELLHGHKMQALGQITAGVAHDLRNILSVISLSNGLIRRGVASQPELAEEANAVEKAVERGRTLALALLGYSRRSDESATPTDTAAVVEDLLRLLGRKFFTGIRLDLSIAAGLPPAAVRSAQLEQLLLNLLVNASDAMNGTGTLRVEVGLGALPSGTPWRIVHPSTATSGILLRIADCGPGIPPENLPRIFEPFFTTKARSAAAGTGLGLSTVFAIADRENLGLAVQSQPGVTEFALLLPLQT
jgi:signal transduction histidine kinase